MVKVLIDGETRLGYRRSPRSKAMPSLLRNGADSRGAASGGGPISRSDTW
jgi:hypothetical protein